MTLYLRYKMGLCMWTFNYILCIHKEKPTYGVIAAGPRTEGLGLGAYEVCFYISGDYIQIGIYCY